MDASVNDVEIGVADETLDVSAEIRGNGEDEGFDVVDARRRKNLPQTVLVKVHAASDLRRSDFGGFGKSDPYCRLIVEHDGDSETAPVQETSVRWGTLAPVWDEEFDVELFSSSSLRLEVWDKDAIGSDDFLGEASVEMDTLLAKLDALEEPGGCEEILALKSNTQKHTAPATGTIKVSFQVGGAGAKGRVWKQPSVDKAVAHRCRSRAWDTSTEMPHKPHKLSSSFIMDGQLGEGIALWMRFLRNMTLLFLFLFLLNLPAFLFYMHGTGLESAQGKQAQGNGVLALPSLGNLFGSEDIAANLDAANMDPSKTFKIAFFGTEIELSLYLISILLPSLDLLGILLFLAFVVRLRFSHDRQKSAIDKRTKTAADFSIMVTGVFGKGLDKDALKAYFEQYGQVAAVSMATYNEVFLTCKRETAQINERIVIIEAKVAKAQQLAKEKGKTPPLLWVRDVEQGFTGDGKGILASRKAVHIPLVFELETSRKALEKLTHDLDKLGEKCDDVYAAFVTFEDEAGRRACLDSVSLRDSIPVLGNSSRGQQMKNALISEAPEVSDVAWENLQYGLGNRRLRSLFVVVVAVGLLAGSFTVILIAQIYQRYNPLPSCPPALLDSKVDATSREYFINSAPSAWGPGARAGPSSRASGLSRVLSELVFDNFGVCEGGGSDGLSCEKDDDCLVLQGSGTCRFYDLRCSYKMEMERANEASTIKDMSQGDRASLLSDSFVVPTPSGTNSSFSEDPSTKADNLRWDRLGLPPMCDQGLFVLRAASMQLPMQVHFSTDNYTFSEANYSREHNAAGKMNAEACIGRRPALGSGCALPPENCTRWPGCNYSAWPSCEGASLDQPRCTESLIISSRVDNSTSDPQNSSARAHHPRWVGEVFESPTRSVLERCSPESRASGNMTCTLKVEVKYMMTRREFTSMPVYSEHVCQRYKEQCAACFCVDTIANFWVIWFFSLSPGYSDLCSVQFSNMVREYAIFVGAAVSVTGVNMLLKMLLRSFAGFEKSHTKSEKEKSIAVKIFAAQFFNTALVPLLVYARVNSLSETVCREGIGEYNPADDSTFGYNGMPCQPNERANGKLVCEYGQGECRAVVPDWFPIFRGEFTDFQNLWYSTVGTSILITVMVNMVLTLLPLLIEWPMQIFNEKIAPMTAVTQRQLNRAFEGPDFELAARYGVILNNIFSSMLYSAGSPVFYAVAALTCGFAYIADKLALHFLYKTPTRYNDKLAVFTSQVLPAAAFVHCAFAIWKYSSVMPIVPVSQAITSSVAAAIADGCEMRKETAPDMCAWGCREDNTVACAYTIDQKLFVNHTACEERGLGKCVGSDPSLLDFNFLARLFTWSTFPTFVVFSLFVLFYVVRIVLLNALVRPVMKKCCRLFVPQNLMKTIDILGIDDDDDDGISYTQAVCLTEQSPKKKAHSMREPESGPSDDVYEGSENVHVHWNGLRVYDITKISAYRDAFSDLHMSRSAMEQDDALVGDADNIWLSPDAQAALRRALAHDSDASPHILLSPAPSSRNPIMAAPPAVAVAQAAGAPDLDPADPADVDKDGSGFEPGGFSMHAEERGDEKEARAAPESGGSLSSLPKVEPAASLAPLKASEKDGGVEDHVFNAGADQVGRGSEKDEAEAAQGAEAREIDNSWDESVSSPAPARATSARAQSENSWDESVGSPGKEPPPTAHAQAVLEDTGETLNTASVGVWEEEDSAHTETLHTATVQSTMAESISSDA